jgi:superfamily I DNA/RNA helicase
MKSIQERAGLTTASHYQIDMFEHIVAQIENYLAKQPTQSMLGNATAGSGKTTTVVAMANLIPTNLKAIFIAFNKPIVVELSKRLPKHVHAKTYNSVGWGITKRYADTVEGRQISFDDFGSQWKTSNIMRDIFTKPEIRQYGDDVRFLVAMAKNLGIVPLGAENAEPVNGLLDEDDTWNNILAHYNRRLPVDQRPTVFNMVRKVLLKTLEMHFPVDFDDQKYFPAVKRGEDGSRLPSPKYDIVLVDEAQDSNVVDIALIKLILKPNGIVIGVGDPHQSIYGFRGADANAMDNFKAEFNARELPLSISYRCAKKIVKRASHIYPDIEAAPGAIEGEDESYDSYKPDIFQAGDMIICRNNAPTVQMAFKLIANRIPVFVKGRDIGRGLITLIDKLKSGTVADLANDLNLWQAQQLQIIHDENPDDEAAIQRVSDVHATIRIFIDGNSDGRIETLKKEIEEMFSVRTRESDDDQVMKGKVILSTVHKAKGLEADRVFFLDGHLMFPAPGRKLRSAILSSWP